MARLGAGIAILDDEDRILLIKREDFQVWALPGGDIDPGESAAQAAVREAREETGLDVKLTRLVGLYALPQWKGFNDHVVLFAARPVGGAPVTQTDETVDAAFFAADALPDPMMPWHLQRIADVLAGYGGSTVVHQDMTYPFAEGISRQELYRMRDISGLSPQVYFMNLIKPYPVNNILEVEGSDNQA